MLFVYFLNYCIVQLKLVLYNIILVVYRILLYEYTVPLCHCVLLGAPSPSLVSATWKRNKREVGNMADREPGKGEEGGEGEQEWDWWISVEKVGQQRRH